MSDPRKGALNGNQRSVGTPVKAKRR